MAQKHLDYLAIAPGRRRTTAGKLVEKLKESLSNPSLTEDQTSAITDRIQHVTKWAAGSVPTSHIVDVSEEIPVSDD